MGIRSFIASIFSLFGNPLKRPETLEINLPKFPGLAVSPGFGATDDPVMGETAGEYRRRTNQPDLSFREFARRYTDMLNKRLPIAAEPRPFGRRATPPASSVRAYPSVLDIPYGTRPNDPLPISDDIYRSISFDASGTLSTDPALQSSPPHHGHGGDFGGGGASGSWSDSSSSSSSSDSGSSSSSDSSSSSSSSD